MFGSSRNNQLRRSVLPGTAGLRSRRTPPRMAFVRRTLFAGLALGAALVAGRPAAAVTFQDLRQDANLTPERLGAYFRDFQFKPGDKRQSAEKFLAARSGDCDDFASLAADVLHEKKYTTTLVAIFMEKQTHVVCYVEEIHGYLDYNLRKQSSAVQSTSGKLEDIADKVAAYFRSPWHCVSEFTYQADRPRYGRIAFR